jgi:hypothetical protein
VHPYYAEFIAMKTITALLSCGVCALLIFTVSAHAQDDDLDLERIQQMTGAAGLANMLGPMAGGEMQLINALGAQGEGAQPTNVQIKTLEVEGNAATIVATAIVEGEPVMATVSAKIAANGWQFSAFQWRKTRDRSPGTSLRGPDPSTALRDPVKQSRPPRRQIERTDPKLLTLPDRGVADPRGPAERGLTGDAGALADPFARKRPRKTPPAAEADSQHPVLSPTDPPPMVAPKSAGAEKSLPAAAGSRTWVSEKGNNVVGTLLRFENDVATIKRSRDRKVLNLKLALFSAKDQAYLQSLATPEPEAANAYESRTWTSSKGNEMIGTLVKIEDDVVTIKRDTGKVIDLGLTRFSLADQNYLKSIEELATPDAPDF